MCNSKNAILFPQDTPDGVTDGGVPNTLLFVLDIFVNDVNDCAPELIYPDFADRIENDIQEGVVNTKQ